MQRALGLKGELHAALDLLLLARQHNVLLLGAGAESELGPSSSAGSSTKNGGRVPSDGLDGGSGAGASDRLRRRVLGYLPAALHYAR